MPTPLEYTGKERAAEVQKMFTGIARHYDLLNRIITGGQDVRWRKTVIAQARLAAGSPLLDIGAGTGDLAQEALKQQPACQPVAADFTLEMMRAGKKNKSMDWCGADALFLPFPANHFDAVVSGYLLRNVTDVLHSLQEQYRVLKPGGRIVALDTTRPRKNILTPLINFHLTHVIPALGGWLTGEREAYTYLPDSTKGFLSAEELADKMRTAGFKKVEFSVKMFGTMAIHWGIKE